MSLAGTMLRFFAERGAKGKSYADLGRGLDETGQAILQKLRDAADNERHRNVTSHVIGIERWGQRRLRTLTGEPLVIDEYDGYRPALDTPLPELADQFQQTREETIALLKTLEAQQTPLKQTVKHNELGDLSLRGWIVYLTSHAGRETRFLIR